MSIELHTRGKCMIPQIYAYTTPTLREHDGWLKIGYTAEQDVDTRIKQQTHTANVAWQKKWQVNAIFNGGGFFRDSDFHAYLKKLDIERKPDTEWFKILPDEAKRYLNDFIENRGAAEIAGSVEYRLRSEQRAAVEMTKAYYESHPGGEFLWNAKPRFGKTLTVYDFCRAIDARKVLIVTNRPAIANSWYDDYDKFVGTKDGYYFVSHVEGLRGKRGVLSRKQYVDEAAAKSGSKIIEFVSLQDLKGSVYFGGTIDKLGDEAQIHWDLLVIDEAHEGVDTEKTEDAFENIRRGFTLHLSGTPFKALANDKFPKDAVYSWTYVDEQRRKAEWDAAGGDNPYRRMPTLHLYTYQMSEMIRGELRAGIEIEGENAQYTFDLNEFFKTKKEKDTCVFEHDKSVDKFLDALTTQEKYPFSTPELREELKHTFWLLNRVDSAEALRKKLEAHPVFKEYKIVMAAGDGRGDEENAIGEALTRVREAIDRYPRTITLSVGRLTTGVTVPEWSGVLMLSSIQSPSLYMQAAFRCQNPWEGISPCDGQNYYKKNAYVFDFDPVRTLMKFEEIANDLSSETSEGRGSAENRRRRVGELLNFFPVIGEDDQGTMVPLDAEKVLSIPRKIQSREVVRSGFMHNYLFENISNIFAAPKQAQSILSKLAPVEKTSGKKGKNADISDMPDIHIDENGGIAVDSKDISDGAENLFGSKIYEKPKDIETIIDDIDPNGGRIDENIHKLKTALTDFAVKEVIDPVKKSKNTKVTATISKHIRSEIENAIGSGVDRSFDDYREREKDLAETLLAARADADTEDALNAAEAIYRERQIENKTRLDDTISEMTARCTEEARHRIVEEIIRLGKEKEKDEYENAIRDHLRGFSRCIPAFLMAYGNEDLNLRNFDAFIPGDVFEEITNITLEEFRFLRDGGNYTENGIEKWFEGRLFNEIVFDDSIREFLRLKDELSNYFDDTQDEDIFDYIPPQKTNQIFTPRKVVREMLDLLEQENPGCFDNPDKTFADLYMKSGMYIAEIVKRLYRSPRLCELYPDKRDRLNHIFGRQVYGLAPTEVIYRIASNYILGFDIHNEIHIEKHHFKQADAMEYIKRGTLESLLETL